MDKQVDESVPQEPNEKPDKMIAPEDVTYSQHDQKKEAIPKTEINSVNNNDDSEEDESYLDKNQ